MEKVSAHYDEDYFEWQKKIGEFGGWANQTKFQDYIKESDSILDFGCGGGFLLDNLKAKKKVGVEINPDAVENARKKGLEIYTDAEDVPNDYIDVVISNNALEHTLNPLEELKELYKKIKVGGKIVLVVPCDSISYKYSQNDIHNHLYSWSPMNLGNLLTEAGFSVEESKPYIHKWPPKFMHFAKLGRTFFDITCRIYGRLETSWYEVRAIGIKK